MTAASAGSILAKTATGAGWVIGFRITTRLAGLVSTLTLVHLLGPGDFGLVALATGFAQTVDAFANLSVHEAIVREHAPPRAMYDTAFTMNLIRGLLTAALIFATARPVADFFREPRLADVLVAIAAANLIGAIENIRVADFMRTFAFHMEFRLWTIPRLLQVAITIGCAVILRSYWALVIGIMSGRLLRTALSYWLAPYRPRITLVAWQRIAGFTTWSWAISLVQLLRDRSDTAIIGRLFSPAKVGIYALGGEIATLPTSELIDPLCRACFPGFSELRNNGLSVGETWLRLIAASAMVVLPAGVGIAAVADPLVRLAFGPGWLQAIPMVQVLGITATTTIVYSLSSTLFSAYGMLRTIFAITIAATVLRIFLLVVFLPGGTLVTAAILVAIVVSGEQCVYIALTMRRFNVRGRDLVRAVYRSVLCTAAMSVCLVLPGFGFVPVSGSLAWHLATTIAVGAASYGVAMALGWLVSGRPPGPERDLLNALAAVGHRVAPLRARMRRRVEPNT